MSQRCQDLTCCTKHGCRLEAGPRRSVAEILANAFSPADQQTIPMSLSGRFLVRAEQTETADSKS